MQNDFRQLREKYRKTQSEIADILGVSVRTIAYWEKGNHIPKKIYIKTLKNHFYGGFQTMKTFDTFNTQRGNRMNTTSDGVIMAVDFLKFHEGFRADAYPDPARGWDVATIGYGTTKYAISNRVVRRGDRITKAGAEVEMKNFLDHSIHSLSTIPAWDRMRAEQKAALFSFGYNLGMGFFRASNFEHMTDFLLSEKFDDKIHVLETFTLYNNHNLLTNRRIAETFLFLGLDWRTIDMRVITGKS